MLNRDIFFEDEFAPTIGLIRRYKNRALVELTLDCPLDCPFCYRKWKKEQNRKTLDKKNIDQIATYISKNKEITELILSGGEPLMVLDLLEYAMDKFSELKQITVFRIHTRAVITSPKLVSNKLLDIFKKKYRQIIYLSIHINHYNELNKSVEKAIEKIRNTGVILYSQSVFLKGINDSSVVLKKLFKRLVELGVRPYNIYRCNKIEGIEKFVVPFEKELKIMTQLRKDISGFACPTYIIDVPGNANKIPVPLDFWEFNKNSFKDFDGKITKIADIECL